MNDRVIKALRQISLVTSGNLVRAGSSFLVLLIISRELGPFYFGLFAIAFSTLTLLSQLSDSGLGVGTVKFLSANHQADNSASSRILAQFLILRLSIAVFLGGALFLASHQIAFWIHKPELFEPFRVVAAGLVGSTLLGYVYSALQAQERYRDHFSISILNALLSIVTTISIAYLGEASLQAFLWCQVISILIPAIFGIALLAKHLREARDLLNGIKKIIVFSRWTSLAGILSVILLQLDLLLLSSLVPAQHVGQYAVAHRFAFIGMVLTNSIGIVLLPKATRLSNSIEIQNYHRIVWRFFPLSIAFIVGSWILLTPLIPLLFGTEFEESKAIFIPLIAAFGLGSITNPLSFLLFTADKPEILAISQTIQIIIVIGAAYGLVPHIGALGMSAGILVSRIFSLLFISGSIRRITSQNPQEA